MIELKPDIELMNRESPSDLLALTFHQTFYPVHSKLKRFISRFANAVDSSIFNDMLLVYLLATRKYLDHRKSSHLFRLILSIHFIRKKLIKASTLYPHNRHLEIRWLPTSLLFPFATKHVLGCIIGFNVMDRYELFDEENILLALQKYLPELKLVKESSYCHTSQYKNIKIFYLEIEKRDSKSFSLSEKNNLKNILEEKIKNSIQTLSPNIFMGFNDEEVYKNILVLSQEIQTLDDVPQASISLDQQSGKEVIFRITLVYISPFHHFSLKERFVDATFVSQRSLVVRHIDDHPIEAHIFRLHLPRDASYLRSDGSLDFYSARKKVVDLLTAAIGEFRDYNGGVLIKQQELLQNFKECFPEIANRDEELLESFFYSIVPLEKQVILADGILSSLFSYYNENRKKKIQEDTYSFNIYHTEHGIFLIVHGKHTLLSATINAFLQENAYKVHEIAYNLIDNSDGVFFNCVLLESDKKENEEFIQSLKQSIDQWHKKVKNRQVLRIGLEYSIVSLDPRIGGEVISGNLLRLLFEGLTRFDEKGEVENAIAHSIQISSDKKQYIFKLRKSLWNDGSPVSAFDFEYSWKKILSPSFKTSLASLLHPIKNAKEAKEGKVPVEQIGVKALDDFTLQVDLARPTSYFLQLTSHAIYSPVHHIIDQQQPEWPYQCEKHYPCNGPFQLKINQPNQGYQLVKNPYYWDADRIILDQITLTQTNPAQAMQAFQNKEIDWVGNPFGNWNSPYGLEKIGKMVSVPNFTVNWLVFNTSSLPFNNKKLRQAFAYTIERSRLISNGKFSINPSYSPLPPPYDTSAQFPKCNLEKAAQLFDEGLHELGIKKQDLPPLKLIYVEKGMRESISSCLLEQFENCLGIDIQLKPLPWSSLFNNMTHGAFQIGLMQWTSWVNTPVYTLSAFRSADQEVNFSKWENPEFQRWLDLTEQELNPFQHSFYLKKAEEILSDEMPIIPLFFSQPQALVSKDLIINPSGCGFFNFAKSYFKNEEK